jgi:hypothetical protein
MTALNKHRLCLVIVLTGGICGAVIVKKCPQYICCYAIVMFIGFITASTYTKCPRCRARVVGFNAYELLIDDWTHYFNPRKCTNCGHDLAQK